MLNSLVIFVVGFGTANLGHEASVGSAAPGAGAMAPTVEWIAASMTQSAHAADESKTLKAVQPAATGPTVKPAGPAGAAEADKLKLELEALRLENERLKQAGGSTAKPTAQKPAFFRKW